MKRVHIYISGMVQGVFYRYNAQLKAKDLDLTGWVRNLNDGRVEVLAEGEVDRITEFIAWCERGSPASRVDEIKVKDELFTGEFMDFEVRAE